VTCHPPSASFHVVPIPPLAKRYDRLHGLRRGETILVISNSGKNASPIEVALYAKQKGLTVVGLECR